MSTQAHVPQATYPGVDLNPMPESTLSPSQGLRIWPLGTGADVTVSIS